MSDSVQQLNQQLANQINSEVLNHPNSPYAGKFVGIADGEVVVVADTLDEVGKRLRQEPDPSKTFCIEAGLDYDEVQEIWMTESCLANNGHCNTGAQQSKSR